jgi:predicted dithiol-disulfide oxidoreductase (DUF899 family)
MANPGDDTAAGQSHTKVKRPGSACSTKTNAATSSTPYSSYARGGDLLIGTYNYLDLMPKGRNEEGDLKGWVRRHDEYER